MHTINHSLFFFTRLPSGQFAKNLARILSARVPSRRVTEPHCRHIFSVAFDLKFDFGEARSMPHPSRHELRSFVCGQQRARRPYLGGPRNREDTARYFVPPHPYNLRNAVPLTQPALR